MEGGGGVCWWVTVNKSREVGINRTAAARVLVPTFLLCAIQVSGWRPRGAALP